MKACGLEIVDGSNCVTSFVTTGFQSQYGLDWDCELEVVDGSEFVTTGIFSEKGGEKTDGIYQSREGNDVPDDSR